MKGFRIIFFLIVLVSCDIGEIPINPVITETEISTIPMGSNYMTQVYYNLNQNQIVSQNNRVDWDIAFESKRDTNFIYLNSSKFVQVWQISETSFYDPIDLDEAVWQWDKPCLINNGAAIDISSQSDIYYVIDLGLDENLESSGYLKFKVISSNDNGYTFRYSSIDNSADTTFNLSKNNSYNKLHFSFLKNSLVNIEPKSNDWDLMFTSYTHIFTGDFPYLVSGVLINSQQVYVACDSINDFNEININHAQNIDYSNCENIIGYDWKIYSFETSIFSINQTKIYIIKNENGYYKLRFLDFYNESGEKGFPKFEILKL